MGDSTDESHSQEDPSLNTTIWHLGFNRNFKEDTSKSKHGFSEHPKWASICSVLPPDTLFFFHAFAFSVLEFPFSLTTILLALSYIFFLSF